MDQERIFPTSPQAEISTYAEINFFFIFFGSLMKSNKVWTTPTNNKSPSKFAVSKLEERENLTLGLH